MKLFMKGKVFDHLDTMTVTDAAGQAAYTLENDRSGLRHRIVMKDAAGKTVAHIEQRPHGKGNCYVVTMGDGREVATVEKKPTLKPAYTVSGPDWEVTGSLFSTKYQVTKGGKDIAELKVATLRSEITIDDGEDPVFAAAVVMAIRIALYYTQVAATVVTAAVINT